MKILVTGAAGFIGTALVEALATRSDVKRILAFDQTASSLSHAKVEVLHGNLATAPMARSLSMQRASRWPGSTTSVRYAPIRAWPAFRSGGW